MKKHVRLFLARSQWVLLLLVVYPPIKAWVKNEKKKFFSPPASPARPAYPHPAILAWYITKFPESNKPYLRK